jgi:hypothetical protein
MAQLKKKKRYKPYTSKWWKNFNRQHKQKAFKDKDLGIEEEKVTLGDVGRSILSGIKNLFKGGEYAL